MGTLGGSASGDVERPIAEVWAVVADVASSPEWQDGLNSMEPLERDAEGRVARARSTSDAKVREIATTVRFTYAEPRTVSWVQEDGDLKAMSGGWELEELGPDRTRATYRMEADPGRMLGMLLRGPVEDRIRQILVGARPAELAARLER